MIGSIAEGETVVSNFMKSEDTMRTVDCFRKMGIDIEEKEGELLIRGKGLKGLTQPKATLDVGNSWTTIRLLLGILAGQPFKTTVTGDESIRRRPMGRVVDPLKRMGAEIHGREKDTLAPMMVSGRRLTAIEYKLLVASAQVKSAILLAGLFADGITKAVEKEPTRDHTERMLSLFGANIKKEGLSISIEGWPALRGRTIEIPGDISSAAFIMILAAMIPGSEISLRDVGVNPGRTGTIEVLHRMGAGIQVKNERMISEEPVADIVVTGGNLKAIELSGSLIPRIIDEIPILAVLATQAKGETVIKGAEELRVKESDRIATMVKELKRFGADIKELRDGMIISGPVKLKGVTSRSYGDHRVAMATAIAALISQGESVIEGVECVDTSFPEFPLLINKLAGKNCIEIK
jgi:3-phosphoshikimate 1-carboxyvinyltransferase